MTEIFAGSVPLCASYTQGQLHNPGGLPFFQTIFLSYHTNAMRKVKRTMYLIDGITSNIQHSTLKF